MTKHQIFILSFTFIVGIFSGMYVYVTGFAPQYVDRGVAELNTLDGAFSVIGEQTGGCQMMAHKICASFILNADRSYTYVPAYVLTEEAPESVTGTLSRSQYKELIGAVVSANADALQAPGTICVSAADGIDYEYYVTYDTETVRYNSCGTEFAGSNLYMTLYEVWQTIETDIAARK